MKQTRVIILAIGLFGLLVTIVAFWAFPKVDQFFKVDGCLDKGGRWNYKTNECEFENTAERPLPENSNELTGYNQLANEKNRKTFPVSEYNTDLTTENIERPKKSVVISPVVDTSLLFNIWTLDPNGPHADFWFKQSDFYIVDYDGNGAMPYILDQDSLTIFYNDFIQKGKIVSVGKDTLTIHWKDSQNPTKYVEWKR